MRAFSQLLKKILQVPLAESCNGHGPAANFDRRQADIAACAESNQFVGCWSHLLLSVGHVRLFSAFQGESVAILGISMIISSKAQYQKPSQPW